MAKQIPYYIIALAKDVFGVWPDETSRKRQVIDCKRAVVCYLKTSQFNDNISLTQIGAQLGGKDHATIIHHLKKHSHLYETDKNYQKKYDLFFRNCEAIRKKRILEKKEKAFYCYPSKLKIMVIKKAGTVEPAIFS